MQMRRRLIQAALSAAIMAGFGCGAEKIVGPNDFERLDVAEEKWHARSFADYSYEVRSTCFCPPELTRWTRVTVQDGKVVEAVPVVPDPYFPNNTLRYWMPVDSIFAGLRHFMSELGGNTYYQAVIAQYDTNLGYPTNIEYRAKPGVADAGGTTTLRNVRPLQ